MWLRLNIFYYKRRGLCDLDSIFVCMPINVSRLKLCWREKLMRQVCLRRFQVYQASVQKVCYPYNNAVISTCVHTERILDIDLYEKVKKQMAVKTHMKHSRRWYACVIIVDHMYTYVFRVYINNTVKPFIESNQPVLEVVFTIIYCIDIFMTLHVLYVKHLAFKLREMQRREKRKTSVTKPSVHIDLDLGHPLNQRNSVYGWQALVISVRISYCPMRGWTTSWSMLDKPKLKSNCRMYADCKTCLWGRHLLSMLWRKSLCKYCILGEVTVSTIGCPSSEVNVFDSMPPSISSSLENQVASLLCSTSYCITLR